MSECYYSVGRDDDGSTVLTIGDHVKTTLTMSENATLQLIRLLAATLENNVVAINPPSTPFVVPPADPYAPPYKVTC